MNETPPPDTSLNVEEDNAARIAGLLGRLNWSAPLIVLFASLALAGGFYSFQARPMADDAAFARQQFAAEQVMAKTENMVGQIERILLTMQEWAKEGLISLDDPAAFNRLMIPVMQQRGIVSSIHLASDEGRETLLLKIPDGWKNRLTNVPKTGTRQHWLIWADARTRSGEEWKEQDYDPRKRPWFSGALSTPEKQIHWTAPYVFQTTKDPGITASVRWKDDKTGKTMVVAFDVMLTDLSRFTSQLSYGERGQVALLTSDGKVLGLPRHEKFANDDALRKAVLQTPENIELESLAALLKIDHERPASDQRPYLIPAQQAGDRENWIARIQPLAVRNQTFRIATLAPESDFSAITGKVLSILGATMLLTAFGALVAVRLLVSAVRRPITAMIGAMDASTARIGAQARLRTELRDISQRLQSAATPEELGQILLSQLAPRLQLGQALFCLWDENGGRLRAVARFGGEGSSPARILAGEACRGNLLAQCAADRRPILLEQPGPGYFTLQSGLGDSDPAAILILPVVHAGRLFAVLEMAAFAGFTAEHRQLLDELEPTVAMSLDILLRAERTAELLAQSRAAEQQSRLLLASASDGGKGIDPSDATFAPSNPLQRILASCPAGVALVDEDDRLVFANPRLGEILGSATASLLNQGIGGFWMNHDEHAAYLEKFLEAGQIDDYRTVLRRGDGSAVNVLLTARRIEQDGRHLMLTWLYDIGAHRVANGGGQ